MLVRGPDRQGLVRGPDMLVEGEEGVGAQHGEAQHGVALLERGAQHGGPQGGGGHGGVQHEDGELRDHDDHGAPRGRRRRQQGLTNSVQPETKQQKPRMESLASGLILRLR